MLGLESHVVHLSGHLMNVQLDANAGAMLKTAIEAMGIQVHLGKATSEVHGAESVTDPQLLATAALSPVE